MAYTNFDAIDLPSEGGRSATFTEPLLRIGTSASLAKIGTADVGFVSIAGTSALAAGNVISGRIAQTMTGASAVNTVEVLQVVMTSEVQVGNWANAIAAKLDFGTAGRVSGTAGVVCAELDMPNTAAVATGSYFCFEGEMNFPTSTTIGGGTHAGFFILNAWGAGVADFDTNGVLFEVTGVSSGSANFWYDHNGTAGGDTVGEWIKVRTPGGVRYIGLYDATH